MKATMTLPENYEEILSVDLKNNKRLALFVNLLAVGIAVIFAVIGAFSVPIAALFDMSRGLGIYALRFLVMFAGTVAYIVLHELVHGIFIRLFSHEKPFYGYTGLYAYAGSHAYFGKVEYIVIALAPIVVWGIVLAILCFLLDAAWFWVVYLIQITNLSGAAGDLYVFFRFLKLPREILVGDSGTAMVVYAPKHKEETKAT